ncbi:HAD family hydrolase [Leeia sp. TBRC 13508]|uniref:HAD family hydrolase n=1 Tax=Leeia speluncae TaxID=2884804 RepID=A0ABS8D655_9NEIS|nr:HAD family hydrolase [Leeia speluncae]MCB6183689.1 HAD family hydrolase [Leeia speluncae]
MSENLSLEGRLKKIKLMVFDVDGVLTDGRLYLNDRGEEMKAFNTLDGHGLKMLQSSGVEVAIITGRRSETVALRAKNLGVNHLYQGVENKKEAFLDLIQTLNLSTDVVGFMGDDWIDLPAMKLSGLAVTVPAATEEVQQRAHLVTLRAGGEGAVRELCERIMKAQGTFDRHLAQYLD